MRQLSLLLVTLMALAHAADLGISPPRLELTLSPGETVTETITLLTNANSDQQIAVSVGDWTLSYSGELIFLPAGSLPYSASAWLLPESSELVLSGRGSYPFRLSLTLPEDAPAGTHHAMVFFTVTPPEAAGSGLAVVTTTRIGLTVYLTVAGSERAGSELVDLYANGRESVTLVVANTGNTVMRLGGRLELRDEQGATRHTVPIPDLPVLRESERELTLALPEDMAPGFYTVLALIEDSRGGLLAGELPLTVR